VADNIINKDKIFVKNQNDWDHWKKMRDDKGFYGRWQVCTGYYYPSEPQPDK
jgi:hypothetical protein